MSGFVTPDSLSREGSPTPSDQYQDHYHQDSSGSTLHYSAADHYHEGGATLHYHHHDPSEGDITTTAVDASGQQYEIVTGSSPIRQMTGGTTIASGAGHFIQSTGGKYILTTTGGGGNIVKTVDGSAVLEGGTVVKTVGGLVDTTNSGGVVRTIGGVVKSVDGGSSTQQVIIHQSSGSAESSTGQVILPSQLTKLGGFVSVNGELKRVVGTAALGSNVSTNGGTTFITTSCSTSPGNPSGSKQSPLVLGVVGSNQHVVASHHINNGINVQQQQQQSVKQYHHPPKPQVMVEDKVVDHQGDEEPAMKRPRTDVP